MSIRLFEEVAVHKQVLFAWHHLRVGMCVPSCCGALVGFLRRQRLIGLEVQACMLCLCVMVGGSVSSVERAERIRR